MVSLICYSSPSGAPVLVLIKLHYQNWWPYFGRIYLVQSVVAASLHLRQWFGDSAHSTQVKANLPLVASSEYH